jgi:hypothetical protein
MPWAAQLRTHPSGSYEPPGKEPVRMAGFEPAISCSRNTRNTRLSYVLFIKSAQRELNPHFRHGKATGCRYIIGAKWCAELSMNKSTGRDSNSRRRRPSCARCPGCGILAAGRPVQLLQWDQRDLNPHLAD